MRTCTIRAGKHDDGALLLPWLLKVPNLVRYVRFGPSCAYQLEPYNQKDVNKLYGLSYGLSEDNSARFGWRWNPETERIELLAYVHEQGKLNRSDDAAFDFPVVATVRLGQLARCEIRNTGSFYLFSVSIDGLAQTRTVPHGKFNTMLGITRGFWFGGTQPAPHDVTVELDTYA